jgi:N-acetylglucosaminyldiphosphoundecaprenol N-acetyl-beta-D-mannosaminyltransferase
MIMNNSIVPTRTLIGSPICALPFDEQINIIMAWAEEYQGRMVYVANVHMLIEAWGNLRFADAMRKADLVTPDGLPLVWMLKLMGANKAERVPGMDIFRNTCELASRAQISIFLLGSKPETLEKICQRLRAEFPLLKIAGTESPPFRQISLIEEQTMLQTINDSGAGIVFVALGCPKQELWMLQYREKIQAVMIGVGGVFPVYAGTLKEAPKLIQNTGFEWLFRLLQEPKRLWKRYAVTIPVFIWLSLQQLLSQAK